MAAALLTIIATVFIFLARNIWPTPDQKELVDECISTLSKDKCPDAKVSKEHFASSLATEAEIAQKGHFFGLKPTQYNLSLHFEDKRQFSGSVKIEAVVIQSMNFVGLNIFENLNINFKTISIVEKCSGRKICIRTARFFSKNETLLLELEQFLTEKRSIIIEIPYFKGNVANEKKGSPGVYLADDMGPSWAVGTIFQMRGARTAFPCMDHPTLKATFHLCIRHQKDTTAAGNMPTKSVSPEGANVQLTCFETTPPLPTYAFTFAVFKEMSSFSEENITVISPSGTREEDVRWMFMETKYILGRLENMTGTPFALPLLSFLNVQPSPFWGIENFGLITLDFGWMQYPEYDTPHTILVHEIIHQWLGNLFTISYWDEICLQEGLTAYLTAQLSSELDSIASTFEHTIEQYRHESLRVDDGGETIVQSFQFTQQIADRCFRKPPLIFHMLQQAFGEHLLDTFMSHMAEKFAFNVASLDNWAETLSQIAQTKMAGQMLQSWFTQPGFPVLEISAGNDEITVAQMMFKNNQIVSGNGSAFLLPLNLIDSSGQKHSALMTTERLNFAPIHSKLEWIVQDPDAKSYSRSLYTVANYLHLLACFQSMSSGNGKNNSCHLSNSQFHSIFDDFCFGLLRDRFPLQIDPGDLEAWDDLLTNLRDQTDVSVRGQSRLQLGRVCPCCFKTEEDLEGEKASRPSPWANRCRSTWATLCRPLQIMNKLARNYTV